MRERFIRTDEVSDWVNKEEKRKMIAWMSKRMRGNLDISMLRGLLENHGIMKKITIKFQRWVQMIHKDETETEKKSPTSDVARRYHEITGRYIIWVVKT